MKVNILGNTTKKTKKVGAFLLTYAQPGTGKTTLVADAVKEAGDKGLYITCVEDGLSDLQSKGELDGVNRYSDIIRTYDDKLNKDGDVVAPGLVSIVRGLAKLGMDGELPYTTIGIDSVNLIMESMKDYCFRKYFPLSEYANSIDKARGAAFGFGENGITAYMVSDFNSNIINPIMYLKNECGVNVIMTAHEGKTKVEMKDGTKYDKVSPAFPSVGKNSMTDMIVSQASSVFYGAFDERVMSDGYKKRAISGSGTERVTYLHGDATFFAKTRGRKDTPSRVDGYSWDVIRQYV